MIPRDFPRHALLEEIRRLSRPEGEVLTGSVRGRPAGLSAGDGVLKRGPGRSRISNFLILILK